MKNLRASKVILTLVVFTGALTIVGNGCSRFISEPQSASSTADNGAQTLPETGGGADIPVIPGTKTMNVASASQALDHFATCSGLIRPSDRTIATYLEKKGSLSTTGAVNTITPASLMAMTALIGDVCDDLIEQDKINPRLFINFNFSSSSLPSDTVLSKAIARLSLSCWERQPDSQEASGLLNMLKASIAAGEVNGHRKAAEMACTTILASLDAITN